MCLFGETAISLSLCIKCQQRDEDGTGILQVGLLVSWLQDVSFSFAVTHKY